MVGILNKRYDGIGLTGNPSRPSRDIGWGTTKHLNTDNTFLQLLEVSGKRLIHNVSKCATLTISLVQNIGQATGSGLCTRILLQEARSC